MKIPALRAKIGDWTYYVATLTFNQVSEFVSTIDDQLHKSKSLKELIQRSVTNNVSSIKEYILDQPELFFNAIVLAVYDDYPVWREIELSYDNNETYQVGLLEFPGTHKVFPLDGQHRVEGIKAALKANKKIGTQRITAIFVGHKNGEEGMRRSRRLFSTLNRYAKPVTKDDIIALDEDDSVAIATRELLETFELFTGNRVTKNKNKAIHDTDKTSFTSIITLYQCNKELLKVFRKKRKAEDPNEDRDKKKLDKYLKFRPKEIEVELFNSFCIDFWDKFASKIGVVKKYLKIESSKPAKAFRNSRTGGNLLFRPVGLLPFVQATTDIYQRENSDFGKILMKLDKINLDLHKRPWPQVVWNDIERNMIMGNQGLTRMLILYLYRPSILKENELRNLKIKYAGATNEKNVDSSLKGLKA